MQEDKIKFYSVSQKFFYKDKIDENLCTNALDFISSIKNEFNHRTWNCDIKTSNNYTKNILNLPQLRQLKLHVLQTIDNYMTNKNEYFDGYISHSWVNIYEKNFYQESHTHWDAVHKFICGVLYLTNNNSEISFGLDNMNAMSPKFADILVFDDDLVHRVLPNKNEDLRISLAFNFKKCAIFT